MAPIEYKVKVKHPEGSSRAEIKAESDSISNHRYGRRNNHGRLAGTYNFDGVDEEAATEYLEGRSDFKNVHDLQSSDLFTVRDVVKSEVDWSLDHLDTHPINVRQVYNISEHEIKDQPKWPANVEKAKQEEEERKKHEQQHKHDNDNDPNSNSDSDSGKGSSLDSDKKPDNYKDKDKDDAKDQEYRRNRKGGDTRAHASQPSHDSPDQASELSSAEQRFLQHLQQESKHLSALETNLGIEKSPLWNYDHRVNKIDEKDQNTPDNWIPRSTDLIRQTGNHPMNAEPTLSALFDAGLITPNKLHYVRNHGAVPRLNYETHRLHVFSEDNIAPRQSSKGLETEAGPGRCFSMADLSNLDWINIPVALACDGNRRKELNLIKRSKGFNWGPGAISNAYWKGPTLVSVLEAAGFTKENILNEAKGRRLYVHFEGADELSEGKYATSVSLEYALDPCNDVLLAQQMNDVPLAPDHGWPIRLIIPGYVGGRCVKWLEKVWISARPNDSHYHIWDNRVLPSFVTEKDGPFAETMFRHPDTACMEQNLNSVIVRPAQGEQIQLDAGIHPEDTYKIEGYAYDGGGCKVQKIEVSLDAGRTWIYAYRRFPDNALRHGKKFWTWCFWYCHVKLETLVRAEELRVRAWNVFKNTQPDEPTWNIMGMMNNAVYRVRPEIKSVKTDDRTASILVFRHPTDPSNDDGWMRPSMEIQISEAKQSAALPNKKFTREEIEKHNTKESCWLVVNNTVYDATSVLEWHPGGANAILGQAGKVVAETSEQYNSIHDDFANHKLEECAIGTVTDKAKKMMKEEAKTKAAEVSSKEDRNHVLKQHLWTGVKLKHKEELSRDTRKYTFEFPMSNQKLGLPPGKHVLLGVHFEDKMVFRAYTPTRPILDSEEDGTFDVLVKTYFPSEKNPGGTLSNVLDTIKVGSMVDIRGPTGEIEYRSNGRFNIEGNEYHFKNINLIGGGSGVTPHYQLCHRILNTNDKTHITFVYGNSNEDNILLREELDMLAELKPDRFRLIHILSHPSDSWKGEKGHIDGDLLKRVVTKDDAGTFLCGPPPMIKSAHEALTKLGFKDEETLFAF